MALALQLGLSFGHFHRVEAVDHAPALAAAGPEEPQGSHQDHGDDRAYCPSCAILNLLAGAQAGADLASAEPVLRAAEDIIRVTATIRPANVQAAFRARAPPLA